MMLTPPPTSFLSDLLEELSARRGAKFFCEPKFGYVGYIEFGSGKKSFFTGSSLEINSESAAKIASDKDYTALFLNRSGLQAPKGLLLYSPAYRREIKAKHPEMAANFPDAATITRFADEALYPLFIKPNHGASGRDIYRIKTSEDLRLTLTHLFRRHTKLLLQPSIIGRDFRVLVLNGAVVSAYERIPFRVTGNGTDTIQDLLKTRIEALKDQGRASGLRISDARIASHLASQGRTLGNIIRDGDCVHLLPNANLSTGGDVVEALEDLSEGFKTICITAANSIGLRFAGVDVLCDDPGLAHPEYTILELNSAPGMKNYAALGPKERRKVLAIYDTILDLLEAD